MRYWFANYSLRSLDSLLISPILTDVQNEGFIASVIDEEVEMAVSTWWREREIVELHIMSPIRRE